MPSISAVSQAAGVMGEEGVEEKGGVSH